MDEQSLKKELKNLLIAECDIDIPAEDIDDNEQLIGSDTRLALDSLDALSISLEVKGRFGVHIDSGNETRLALTSINTLATFILAQQ